MGSDTYGQCGLGNLERQGGGPFIETKVTNPTKIKDFELHRIQKVFAAGDHSFAVTEN